MSERSFLPLSVRKSPHPSLVNTTPPCTHQTGTPTEANWPGYTALPDYPRYNITPQPPPELARLLPSFRPDELDLLKKLLSLDPNARPTAEEALDHEYFRVEPRATPPAQLPLPLEGKEDEEGGGDGEG